MRHTFESMKQTQHLVKLSRKHHKDDIKTLQREGLFKGENRFQGIPEENLVPILINNSPIFRKTHHQRLITKTKQRRNNARTPPTNNCN